MGGCQSKDEEAKSKEGHASENKEIKLLLLGTGGSGKTTVLKQLRLAHDDQFKNDYHTKSQKDIVVINACDAINTILVALPRMEVELEMEIESQLRVFDVLLKHKGCVSFTVELAEALHELWSEKVVRDAAKRVGEFGILENAEHFLSNLGRISHPDYILTDQDILMTHVTTAEIEEYVFPMKNVNFRVVDVGGVRAERKKWDTAYKGVNAIIFVAAVSEYDQKLPDEREIELEYQYLDTDESNEASGKTKDQMEERNRLIESMSVFEGICNLAMFQGTPIILFLNKKDLLEEKITRVPLNSYFKDYRGGANYEDAVEFFKCKFKGLYKNKEKMTYVHETCATDTDQMYLVLDSCIDMIIAKNLSSSETELYATLMSRHLYIGTINARTLGTKDKQTEMELALDKIKCEVLAVQEARNVGCTSFNLTSSGTVVWRAHCVPWRVFSAPFGYMEWSASWQAIWMFGADPTLIDLLRRIYDSSSTMNDVVMHPVENVAKNN